MLAAVPCEKMVQLDMESGDMDGISYGHRIGLTPASVFPTLYACNTGLSLIRDEQGDHRVYQRVCCWVFSGSRCACILSSGCMLVFSKVSVGYTKGHLADWLS